jgi:hypothetical protein
MSSEPEDNLTGYVDTFHDQENTPEVLKECQNWIRSRPRVCQDLIIRFPPGSVVELLPEAPFCESHDFLKELPFLVCSYFESGHVGIIHTNELGQYYKLDVEPEHLKLVAYRNEITRDFVEEALNKNWEE